LTINKTLSRISLSVDDSYTHEKAKFGGPTYEAFRAMLCVNTYIIVSLPPTDDASSSDQKLVESRNQMRIEQELNLVGRGRLLSPSQTPRKEWVDALIRLNYNNIDESPQFSVSCLYSLLRLNPATCM
jgi:hypothetical protein